MSPDPKRANTTESATAKPARRKPCPICGRPSDPAATPFCSDRCRDVDLARWLTGSYVIPASPTDEDDDGN
jgi:endogenous inhibitor of DNA gyrase (YacG/DUF329 family)